MEHFKGAAVVAGSRKLVEDAKGFLVPGYDRAGVVNSWSGGFDHPGPGDLARCGVRAGGTYRLLLADGRSVEIVMKSDVRFYSSGAMTGPAG